MQRESVYQADKQDSIAICVRFPRAMYERIKIDAARDNRSLGRQAVHLCTLALRECETSECVDTRAVRQESRGYRQGAAAIE